jgi:hypothetical protein
MGELDWYSLIDLQDLPPVITLQIQRSMLNVAQSDSRHFVD